MALGTVKTTVVSPSVSIGFLRLGSSIHTIVSRLRADRASFSCIEICYSAQDPLRVPIIILLKENGLRLTFDPEEQRLRLVEVLEWGKMVFSYKNTEFGKHGNPKFRTIYNKVFGPTFPGKWYPDSGTYILSYPGISFSFELPAIETPSDTQEFVKYLSNSSSLACKSFAIFKGHSWEEGKRWVFDNSINKISSDDLFLGGETGMLDLDGISIDLQKRKSKFKFLYHKNGLQSVDITLNSTTMQDVIVSLGAPSERFKKTDSRLLIHSDNLEGNQNEDEGIFFNYFDLGFDILFDTNKSPPKVKKIIIHSNVPSSSTFLKYKRCRWMLTMNGDITANSEQYYDDLPEELKSTSDPMLLDRTDNSPNSSVELISDDEDTESEDEDFFMGGLEDIGELNIDKCINKLIDLPPVGNDIDYKINGIVPRREREDWSQSKLYGIEGIIWEVTKNGVISCVTFY